MRETNPNQKLFSRVTAIAGADDFTYSEKELFASISLDTVPEFFRKRLERILGHESAAVSPASPAGKKGIVRVVEAEKTDSSEALREQYKEIQRTGSQAKASAFYDLHRDVFAPDQRQRARS